ncbi:hypothetical protein MKQ68_25325 [Chitinophaga horti]|uniref:Transcriptional regulator n=1 Tax=Chitinophaga horti TaxID=2920382 RepID=A0ABY6J5A1_9BACT|nr:hypothetical protein [Chitinophaga horti]UYQ93407.1 hypothetical protein MKQ68_25325 [Chitinophaga horti]
MFVHHLDQDITVFYRDVPSFPAGIKEAFDELYEKFEGRNYYGLSHMDVDGRVIYKAAAEGTLQEAAQYGYGTTSIPKGDWLTEKVTDWMSKTDSIKDVFGQLMNDPRFDPAYECVEWYVSDDEMWCMVRCSA